MSLPPNERALCAVLAATCVGDLNDVEAALRDAVAAGATPAEVDDVLLLGPPYGGVPRAILAFGVWKPMRGDPVAPRFVPPDRPATGLATFEGVYGVRTGRVLRELDAYHPDLRAAIVEDAYGRMLARPSLSPRVRELVAVPVLTAMRAPRQTVAHAYGARRYGASDAQILAAAETAQKWLERDRLTAALDLLREALAREAP